MVILEKTPTLLKVQHRPYSLWLVTSSWALGIPLFFFGLGVLENWIFYLWWFPLFCGFFLISGILVLMLAGQIITCQFDKTKNRVIFKRKGMLKTQISEYALAEILDVQVTNKAWNPSENSDYQLVIILRKGKSLNISLGKKINLEIVNLIRTFLGFKSQSLSLPSSSPTR